MGLGVKKLEGETWRACVARVAGVEGLDEECLMDFDRAVAKGEDERDAAWEALYEWDCLHILPDEPETFECG